MKFIKILNYSLLIVFLISFLILSYGLLTNGLWLFSIENETQIKSFYTCSTITGIILGFLGIVLFASRAFDNQKLKKNELLLGIVSLIIFLYLFIITIMFII